MIDYLDKIAKYNSILKSKLHDNKVIKLARSKQYCISR